MPAYHMTKTIAEEINDVKYWLFLEEDTHIPVDGKCEKVLISLVQPLLARFV